MASEARTKKAQTISPTEEIEILVPPSMAKRRISVMAKKLQNDHVRVVIAAERDIFISDVQPVSVETMTELAR